MNKAAVGRAKEIRGCWVWGLMAVLLPLAVYLRTLCRTIFVGDSGELVAGCFSLGIVHPPGYPLYCLLGRLISLLPVGSVAHRLNFLSALSAALSAGLLFLIIRGLIRRTVPEEVLNSSSDGRWAGACASLGGLLYAFSRTVWSQAVVAEVYTLSLLLLLACILALLRWQQNGRKGPLFLFALLLGLGLAHHPTVLLAIPAFLAFLLWHRGRFFENRASLLLMLGFLTLGLSVFLYLPLRAPAGPPLDWGHPVSFHGFLAHVSRASYGSLSKNPRSGELLGRQLAAWIRLLGQQVGPVLLPLALAGLIFLLHRARDWAVLSLGLFLTCALGVIGLLNFSVTSRELYLVQVFFMPAFAVAALWMGLGAFWLGRGLLGLLALPESRLRRTLGTALIILAPLLAILPLSANFAANDRSGLFQADNLGRDILATTGPNAVVFTSNDTPTFSLAHARIVEGLRPDVSLRHTGRGGLFGQLDPPVGPLDPGKRPLYGTTPADLPTMPGWEAHQVGILYQLCTSPPLTSELLEIWDRYRLEGIEDGLSHEDFFLRELVRNYAAARANLAQELARRGQFRQAREQAWAALEIDDTFYGAYLILGNVCYSGRDYRGAAQAFQRALDLAPNRAEILNNMALVHLKMEKHADAVQLYRRSLQLEPTQAKTNNDLGLAYKQAGMHREAVEAYRRAMELDGDYADPLRNLGVIYAYHLADFRQAIDLWERYLLLRPGDPEAEMMRAEIGRMRETLGD